MRIARLSAITAVVALVALTSSAAEAKLACPQLRDGTGDVREYYPYVGIPDEQLDAVSGNVAATKATLAMEIGLASLAEIDPLSPNGRGYTVLADVGRGAASAGPFVGFSISLDPVGKATFQAGQYTYPESARMDALWQRPARGVVDWEHGKIRAWAAFAAYDDHDVRLVKGTVARRLWVFGARDGAPAPAVLIVDTGRAEARYRFGDPGCIPVGK